MPQTRILYTLGEIKELLAEKHKVPVEAVDVFECIILNYSLFRKIKYSGKIA